MKISENMQQYTEVTEKHWSTPLTFRVNVYNLSIYHQHKKKAQKRRTQHTEKRLEPPQQGPKGFQKCYGSGSLLRFDLRLLKSSPELRSHVGRQRNLQCLQQPTFHILTQAFLTQQGQSLRNRLISNRRGCGWRYLQDKMHA